LDFNAKIEGTWSKGRTSFWYIALLAEKNQPQFLLKVLTSVSLNKLDFNAKDEQSGETVLWQIVKAALDRPELLNLVLENCSIERLDFNAKAIIEPTKDKSIKDLLMNSPLKHVVSKIDLLTTLAHARTLWEEMGATLVEGDRNYAEDKLEAFQEYLKLLEIIADKAHQEGHLNAYSLLATFFDEIGAVEQLKMVAQKIPAGNPFRDEVYYKLAHATVYGLQNDPEITKQIKNKKEHKKTLLEGYEHSLEVVKNSAELRKNMAFNLIYGLDQSSAGFFPSQANEPLLDHLDGGKATCLFAVKALRQKVKLKQELMKKNAEAQILKEKIMELNAKLALQEEVSLITKQNNVQQETNSLSNEEFQKQMLDVQQRMALFESRMEEMVDKAVEKRTGILEEQLKEKMIEIEEYKQRVAELEDLLQLQKQKYPRCIIL
jgi:hypothetical protein